MKTALLIKVLKSGPRWARRASATALGESGDPKVIEPLVAAAHQDRDDDVRAAAATSLGKFEDARAVDALAVVLSDDSSISVREAAVQAISQRRDERAVSLLTAALGDRAVGVVGGAAGALVEIAGPAAARPLISSLAGAPYYIQPILVEALTRCGVSALDDLIEALESDAPPVRSGVVSAITGLGSPAVERLIQALSSGSGSLREGAATALGDIRDSRAVVPLITALQDDDLTVVKAAITALGRLRHSQALEPLLTFTGHPDAEVRTATAEALAYVGGPGVITPLIGLLGDQDAGVQRQVERSLGWIGYAAIEPLLDRFSDENEQVRENTARAVALIGTMAVGPLLSLLNDPDRRVRGAAATSLGKIDYRFGGQTAYQAVQALSAMLEREREPARQAAADGLAGLNIREVADVIVHGLQHPDPRVRLATLTAVQKRIGSLDVQHDFFPAWFGIVKSSYNIRVAESAVAVTNAIVALTRDPNKRVRETAIATLQAIRENVEAKRTQGQQDVSGAFELPLSDHAMDRETDVEKIATEAVKAPGSRYADFTFYDGTEPGARSLPPGNVLRAGQWYRLEVAVRAAPAGLPVEERERRPVREPEQAEPVTIMVTAEGDGFEIEETVQTLTLPPLSDSTRNALFKVRPLRESAGADDRAEIRIRLYYQFNLLEAAVVRAEVVGAFDDPNRSRFNLDRPISFRQERLERDYLDLDHVEPRTMHIDITRRGNHYLFRFFFYNDADDELVFSAPARLTREDLESDLVGIRNIWYDIAMSPTFTQGLEGDPDEFRLDVRRLAQAGRDLWVKLFKRERGSALFQIGTWLEEHPLRRDGVIQVSVDKDATDFVFPWALIYDRPVPRKEYDMPDLEGFWGVRYAIEQGLPTMVKRVDEPARPDGELRLGFMLWEQFRNAGAQKEMLGRLAGESAGRLRVSTPPVTDADACYELLEAGDAHLLYFYTHGYTRHRQADIGTGPDLAPFISRYERLEPGSPLRETYQFLYDAIQQHRFEPDRSWIELTYGKLYLNELYDSIYDLPTAPLVVLNMCESAQVTPSLSDSFFHFFLDRGARTVIGTECPMTVEFAHPFAEKFLGDVLSGRPAGGALLDARRHFMEKKNPLGLAYTLFGLATARFEPAPLLRGAT